jgi:DNA replication protein DnaC
MATKKNSQAEESLLKSNLKQLRLPTFLTEHQKLAVEAANANQDYLTYLLRLTELELATRSSNALQTRIRSASFPVHKDLDTFDFGAAQGVSKLKVLELARGAWITSHQNSVLVGSSGTGKTHLAIALGLAACRLGSRVRFFTAAKLVQKLERAQQNFTLEKFQKELDKADLLICDELGYLSFSRSGAELLFQVIADRYERSSTLITTNLPFSEWLQVFQGERMTAALLDRLTHHCEIFQMTGESYRFRESMKNKNDSSAAKNKSDKLSK